MVTFRLEKRQKALQPGEQPADIAFRLTRDLSLYGILRAIRAAQDRDEEITFGFSRQTV